MLTIFREESKDGKPGDVSMRRVTAFLSFLVGSVAGILTIVFAAPWEVIAVAFGVPYFLTAGLLICTTVTDVKEIISAVRK